MQQHLSVFMLMARSSIYRVMALLAAVAVGEGLLIWLVWPMEIAYGVSLEGLVSRSHMQWIFTVCLVLMCVLLCRPGCQYGSKTGHTLRRLSVTERHVFLWQSVYNSICFFLLWAVQALVALACCMLYAKLADPALVSGQTVFLAFYRSEWLHGLLPLEDAVCWLKNALMIVALGVASAYYPFRQRRGKSAWGIYVMASVFLSFLHYRLGAGQEAALAVGCAVVVIAVALYGVLGKGVEYDV